MPIFQENLAIDCDGALYFRAKCVKSGAAVDRVRSGSKDVEHVVTAGVVVPHVRYDLIVETRVNGNWNGQFNFQYPTTTTTSTTWTTSRLLNVAMKEKQDSVAIDCQITNSNARVEIESIGQKLRQVCDPPSNWVDISTDPFLVEVRVT
jgi:hypothetical protein